MNNRDEAFIQSLYLAFHRNHCYEHNLLDLAHHVNQGM